MSNNYKVHNLPDYFKQYKKSIKTLKNSGTKLQMKTSVWYQRWSKVLEYDMEEADIKWFKNAKLNITKIVWTGILMKEEIKQL